MKPVLIDTSVWRYFFAGRSSAHPLASLLEEDGVVLMHPLVVGELVLGGISGTQAELLMRLPAAERVRYDEVLSFIRHRRLAGKGIGWVDAELLASSLAARSDLWSFDRALASAAGELGVAFEDT